MKIIKSNSVNFSKYCFGGLETEYKAPSDEERIKAANEIIEQGRQIDAERQAAAEAEAMENAAKEEARVESIRNDIDQIEPNLEEKVAAAQVKPETPADTSWTKQYDNQQQIKSLGTQIENAEKVKADAEKTAELNKKLKSELNQDDLNSMGPERSKIGDIADEVTTKATQAGTGLANAFGSLLNKFDKTKDMGKEIQKRANDVNEIEVGAKAGDWADKHKVAAGAIGAGALLGAGLLGKKAYDLAKGKKELQANAYYAFADGNINKDTLIGGPYATRKDAREDKPEATHILKGSTLASYGDFEVAS